MEMPTKTDQISLGTENSGDTSVNPVSRNDVTSAMLMQSLQEIGAALALVESSVMKTLNAQANYQSSTNAAMVSQSSDAVTTSVNALNTFVADMQAIAAAASSSAICGWILGVAFVALSVLTCQPELAVLAIATLALQQSGAMHWMVKELGHAIGSKIGAEIIITVAIAVAAGGLTAVTSAAAAGASTAAETAAADAEQVEKTLASKVMSALKSLPKPVAIGIVAGATAASTTGLVQTMVMDIVNASGLTGNWKTTLEISLTIVVSVLLALTAAGASSGLFSGTTNVMDVAASRGLMEASTATKASAVLFRLLGVITAGAMMGQVGSQAALGVIKLEQANETKIAGDAQAWATLYNAMEGIASNQATATNNILSSVLSQTIKNLMAACRGESLVNLAAARELCA